LDLLRIKFRGLLMEITQNLFLETSLIALIIVALYIIVKR